MTNTVWVVYDCEMNVFGDVILFQTIDSVYASREAAEKRSLALSGRADDIMEFKVHEDN